MYSKSTCRDTLVDALVRTVFIEVLHILVHDATQLLLTENEDVIETFQRCTHLPYRIIVLQLLDHVPFLPRSDLNKLPAFFRISISSACLPVSRSSSAI